VAAVNPGPNPGAGYGAYQNLRLGAQRMRGGSPFGGGNYQYPQVPASGIAPVSPQIRSPMATNPTTAWSNIAQAFGRARTQGMQGPQGEDSSLPAMDPTGAGGAVMAYGAGPNGTNVYYGTQQARDLALAGLQRVRSGFGPNSARFKQAMAAALGVFGPGYGSADLVNLMTPQSGFVRPTSVPGQPGGYGP